MTLVRFNHQQLVNRLANQAFNNNLFDSNLGSFNDCSTKVPYHVNENDTAVDIEFAVPGLSKADFDIELDNEVLTVKTKEMNKDDSRIGFAAIEFEKKFKVSDSINREKISAHTENGILRISLPKTDKAIKKPARAIEIE
jgi:HSP20 family protein